MPREETPYYRRILEALDEDPAIVRERFGWRYGSREKFEARVADLDERYHRIREQGYRSQRDLRQSGLLSQTQLVPEHNAVEANIGRDGEVLFEDGRLRFSIAKALGLDEIPARVLVRHKQWQRRREELAAIDDIDAARELDHVGLQHPDLPDVVEQ